MKVIVLAAGRSTRMKPIEDKVFLNFLGKSLLEWQIESLEKAGFNDFVLVGGAHNLKKIKDFAEKREGENTFKVVEQEDLTEGMCGAVLAAESILEDEQEILVFNANDMVDQSAFENIIEAKNKYSDFDAFIIGRKIEEYFPGGYLEVDKNGKIESIIEKPGKGNEPSDMINLVVHYFRKAENLITFLKNAKSQNDDVYEVALKNMMDFGVQFKAVEYEGFWQAIKYPWHIQKVFEYLVKDSGVCISPKATIEDDVTIKGDVVIDEGVRVFEGAIIKGPAYIGKNSIVANRALVRDSHVGENSVVGFNTEVARSYLGNEVWTHSNYIGDSIIANNVAFGAGTVTGNFRLDEANVEVNVKGDKVCTGSNKFGLIAGNDVRVGINCSLMPGIKIGQNSIVGAGVILGEDLEENKFVKMDSTLKIYENRVDLSKGSRDDILNNLGK